ncbi:MAG: hypothetical protein ABSG13_01735 [Bryobacteraceae bacterium]|jgi:hypothetical protein
MVIEESSREGVLRTSRESLGLSAADADLIDDPMLAALLRRAAGILCPCAPSTIIASVLEGLQYLVEDGDLTEKRLADLADRLIISGDLLELNQVTTDDPTVRGTWVFAAPPSFVERPDGSIFLLGIVPDEVTPLPASLAARIVHEGLLRVLTPEPSANLRSVLRDLGWLELSKTAWLKAPKTESAEQMRESMLQRLHGQPASGAIADALILDPSRDAHYYAGRWVNPTDQNGHFVARRPQAHGAPLWGYAAVMGGAVTKFLDLPIKGMRWRGCDVAWHLQMAIDDGLGIRQTYMCRAAPDGVYLDFFSPLPLWAERRLAVLGRPAPREKCLFTYWIPQREVPSEEGFLRETLWLAREN